jgi:hypothetical protein
MVRIFSDIAAELDFEKLLGQLKIQADTPEFDEFFVLFKQASAVAAPKALLKKVPVTVRTADSICAGGVELNSRILSSKSAGSDDVLFFAATCGLEFDRIKIGEDDFLAAYWLDVIKEECMTQAFSHIQKHTRDVYNYTRSVSLCPSDAGSWPLHELKHVFLVLGHEAGEIGLELSEYCFMKPNKSLCGVLVNIQDHFEACQICDCRDKCDRKNSGHKCD